MMSSGLPAGPPCSVSVGVVIPAYNCARFLDDSIQSVLRQTYPIAQIVVVDDGSTDGSRGVVAAYAPRVTYVRIENAGPARARNVGLAALSTDLVAFLDADDVWLEEKVERQVGRLLERDSCGLVYCGKTLMDQAGQTLGAFDQHEFPEGNLLCTLIHANHISTSSVVVAWRQLLIDLGGFDERADLRAAAEDYELWLRCASSFTICAVPDPLVRYRVHTANLTRNTANRYVGILAALDCLEGQLARSGRLTPLISAALRARRTRIHEEFAVSFLFIQDYPRARVAAQRLEALGGTRRPLFTAVRHLPDWVLRSAQDMRRMIRSAS